MEADAPLCVETLEAGAPENVDDDGGFKILRDILAYGPRMLRQAGHLVACSQKWSSLTTCSTP